MADGTAVLFRPLELVAGRNKGYKVDLMATTEAAEQIGAVKSEAVTRGQEGKSIREEADVHFWAAASSTAVVLARCDRSD